MQIEIVDSMSDIDAGAWNRLAGDNYPFLKHEFLLAAETSGCVSSNSGWSPRHIVISADGGQASGQVIAAMPLYEKTHSWGEFVFDWAWAEAYHRAGLEYYPKLVSAAPFTPAPSPRLLAGGDSELAQLLVESALGYAKQSGHSSLHVQFPAPGELDALRHAGMKLRKDCQFHWHNGNYRSFDDFLATFSSAKRKKARRDRRHVREQGIEFRWFHGDQTDAAIWTDVYQLISTTFLLRGSMPYYDYDFFVEVARRLPRNILVVLAERNRLPVAAAVFYVSANTLYGRYWGSDTHHNALHFEACYYQGIDYCIANDIGVFEPGTQGEHKISRGFVPVATWSAHWLARPEFFTAVGHYLQEEQRHVERYMAAVGEHSPYRDNGTQNYDATPGLHDGSKRSQ